MLPKKTKYTLYAVLLVFVSAIYSTAVANTTVFELLKEVSFSKKETAPKSESVNTKNTITSFNSTAKSDAKVSIAPMFMTIVQGADAEVGCADNGFTVARFNLCGDFDDRIISLSGGPYTSVQWQELTCAPDVNEDCPNTTVSCYNGVSTNQTYTLDASSISSTTGAEYRVIADGQQYFIKVKKSNITQTHVKQDYICGVDGRIQITNLSSAYEFSIDSGSGFGPWQGPIFNNLVPGTYIVKARLQNTPNTCEYPYEPITIDQLDMEIEATFVDAQCSGETGSITVTANNVPGPYKYTLLNDSGVAQEFTAFIPDNPYTFSAVGFGTYTVQVETQQCTGDPLNGIDPPRQTVDTSGNPIVIGNGLVALDASTEVNSSFGCATITSVDITVNTSGGAPPYTFIVNGAGPSSPSYSGLTTYTVTSPGSYDFLITDSNGCTITASSNVESLLPPDVNATGVDGTCTNGGAKINFNVTDARGYNLTYSVDAGVTWVTADQISVTATPGGTLYDQLEVRYQQGGFECTRTVNDVTVSSVGVITGSATKISDRTCDGSGGTIGGQIDFGPVSGGSGSGYTFSIDGTNFTTTTSYTNLVAGTYTPMIEDGGGCRLEGTPITILDVDPPTDIDFIATNSNCTLNTVDLQLIPTLGTGGATIANYSIISPIVDDNGASDTFVSLDATQSYIFQIRDSNGCTYTEGYSPFLTSSIRARVKSGGDLRVCNGATDGTGTFLIDGFGANYTYDINGGLYTGGPQNDDEVDLPLSGPGTYTITVTDVDTGCTDTASFDIIEAAPLSLTGAVVDMSCANGNRGRVTATATGGWGAFRYTLTPPVGAVQGPKSGRTFNNLTAEGNYVLEVEDAEGCTVTFNFALTEIDAPTLTLDTAASDFCYVAGTGATAVVNSTAGSAGAGTHQYRVNGGTLQGNTFTGLTPGNYTIEVVDGNNCTAAINITIEEQLRVNTSLITEIPCGTSDGRIRVNVSGGYTPGSQYEVSTDDGVTWGSPIAFTSNSFNYDTRVDGTYRFRITDTNTTSAACVVESAPLVVNPPDPIAAAAIDTRDVTCGQTANGAVTITPDATSGVPPYVISFNGSPFTAQTVYSNLAVGTYPFTVRDARGCIVNQTVDIILDTTPTPDATVTEIPATCAASVLSGGIRISGVTDGQENFSFIVEDNTGTEVARQDNVTRLAANSLDIFDVDLVPGDYTVITIDANGCTDIDTVTITSNEVVITPIPPPIPADCDDTSFTYSVSVSGGTGSYLIKLEHQPTFYTLSDTPATNDHTFDNATDGITYGVAYTVQVRDTGTNCIYEQEIPPVDGGSLLEITAGSTPGACDVNRNGEITYSITGFTLGDDLLIELLNNDDNTTIPLHTPVTPLAIPFNDTYPELPGDYQVIVTNLSDNCTDAAGVIIDQNLPSIDILTQEPANCNALGQITVQGRGGNGGPYTYAFTNQGNPEPLAGDYSSTTTFTAVAGNYDIYVKDAGGCTSFDIATVILLEPNLPTPTFVVQNQCNPASTSFDILVRMPSSIDTPRYTLGGVERLPTIVGGFWEYTYNVSSPGDYVVDIIDANGCTGQGTATVYDFLAATGDFSTESTCNAADGVITIQTNGGSGDFSYDISGIDYLGNPYSAPQQINNRVFTGLLPGNYQVVVTDRIVNDGTGFCEFTVTDINLNRAALPAITSDTHTDITCHDANDGTIEILVGPDDAAFPFTSEDLPIEYILTNLDTASEEDRNNTGSFGNLSAGRYQAEIVTARGCSITSLEHVIDNPDDFSITINTPPTNFVCESGGNRFSSAIITATIIDPGTIGSGYRYSITGFSNYQSSPSFEVVDNGSPQTFTIYAIDGNGCQATSQTITINPPTDVVPSVIERDLLNCANPERVRIQVVSNPAGPVDFTVRTTSVVAVAPVTNSSGNDYVDVFLPAAGDYIFEVEDNNGGCFYPMPVHTVAEPISPTVVLAEAKPISCFTPGNDGELSITVTDYIGLYDYEVFRGDDPGKTTVIASGTGLDTANNPETISGLVGGNYFVEVTSTAMPFCDGDSNIATIRTPNGDLQVTANEIGNTSCSDDTGKIEAIGSGGWDTSAYEYRLLQSTDGGTTYPNEIAAYSNTNEFENLASGDYRVEIRDVEGCVNDFDITLAAVPQIDAGIREPQALQCPAGNNAVLEAYDPTSGDATSATAGASGGFPGAGYNYRLLFLGSNDNTNIVSTSGLQNSPTFIGTSGGYISAGWYAIEVSSSFNCLFITVPYYVDPPPPVEPRLVQTRVPGCGGAGEMRLDIENYDASFVYEYLQIEDGTAVGVYTDMVGSSVTVTGNAGISYQFDVRKKNALNTCSAVRSNGITMTDASVLTLLPNSPVDPISCASELDGRIESFANGGVGNNMFTLYIGEPTDGFNLGTATIYRGPQTDGTFEGLPEGTDYWVGVTSGLTCEAIDGPFEIVRPAPIVFTADPVSVSCFGEEDGEIRIEVQSGGVGLLQFAIGPNFDEFFSDPVTPNAYVFDELAAGDYEILIKDDNGCFEKDIITVQEPNVLEVTNIVTTPELCIGANDGTLSFDIIGGTQFNDVLVHPTPYYEYNLEKISPVDETGTGVFAPYDGQIIENLEGGASYALYIRDANDCEATEVISITIGVDLTAEPIVEYGCEGIFPNSTTTIEMQERSLIPDLLFALDPVDPTDPVTALAGTDYVFGNLAPGNHTVYIYHENGCTNMVEFTIDAYDPLTLTAIKTGPNELTASAEGGYGGYEFFFQGESYGSETVYTTNESAVVEVRVVDSNGCSAIVTVPFEFTGMLDIPNAFTPDGDGLNDFWSPNNREFFPNIEVKIYDRYGRVVAILNNVTQWDGNYEGSPVPTGDYWYVVNANDKSKIQFVGHFTLYR
ncbi:gliding motility-associated-like protein [Maribacter vaceletii]|uniref:Gliding motility-associated-like protein n=1 Tax=Maribacter vaceletii TaxID=1206816 RepID=A0A495DSN0_9FLAO|nr:T9SS type B sorting domain-containing protein [Maribacter vaceletii]RKR07145.1 gliding motility-associated-like protein [Maribacter vaceletii]